MYRSMPYTVFSYCNYACLFILSALCVLPLIHVLAISLSSSAAATGNIVTFWPVHFTFEAYTETLGNSNFLHALWIGIKRVVLGTSLSMLLVVLAAYPLSKEESRFQGRTFYAWLFVFTMLFHAGLIPTYLVVKGTGLMNTIWALVLPGAVSIWNLILMLNFFRAIPKELEEAALMDGASHLRILFLIYLPISMPAVATLSLFAMVTHWNAWFDGMIYLSNASDYPISTFLRSIIVSENFSVLGLTEDEIKNISPRTVKASQVFIGALPILLVYPFLQRYFVKGVILGSVKE
ncbi:carbohydrate ABC transporter permease [Paenibacillus sp. WQ 127069]|uniref:Carbohydrate ABC transporter permease n=1 Tax=Paenibacillus baimaensis TaxID=2982185 RepID=A0ABT2UCB2_9BACL|nr:carbohydrate ABC transporter permease [Paenibacillus sp. WQ 127069]MCU6792275.1 carbohydrate ABC transporter permease [Paenibacillus sp. WQ 127069]